MTTRDLVNHILLTGQKGYKDMEDGNRISDKMTLLVKEHIKAEADKMVSEKYDELLQQRDELKEALISMMWQFAYYGIKNKVAVMHTGGLSALEDAFVALGLSDPIKVADFEAAVKTIER